MHPLIELRSVSRRFGSTLALDGVSLKLLPGEVHALVGQNGAGKSTALGIISGVVAPDSGEICIDGQPATLDSPARARTLGIACVFQELSLAGGLSVAENIFAGRPPGRFGLVDRRAMQARAERLLADFDFGFDVRQPVERLPAGGRQIVEIAKAVSLGSRILLLDEPTSALTANEVQAMFAIVRKLKARQIGIIYVSHHLNEVFELADRVTVLRDGCVVSTLPVRDTSEDHVVSEMLGGVAVGAANRRTAGEGGRDVLRVRALARAGEFEPVDLTVRSGEVVALAGVVGSRAVEIAQTLAGVKKPDAGRIEIDGSEVMLRSPREAMRAGIAYVPEDRKTEGLFLEFAIADNVTSAALSRYSMFGLMRREAVRGAGERAIARFAIKASGPGVPVNALSGGNQQKVMLAKGLETEPRVLIVSEPTKGVDVGARRQIHEALQDWAARGVAVVLVSSDFAEIVALADRILIVRHGRIGKELRGEEATEDLLVSLATGVAGRDHQPAITVMQ